MKAYLEPSAIYGQLIAPASKSSMQRGCAAGLLFHGTTTIVNPGTSNDDTSALNVIQGLGAKVQYNADNTLTITSGGVNPVADEINCGESGLGIRMFTPLAALSSHKITINGTGSLLNRPMDFFDEIFPELGISIESRNGRLPIQIQGPLKPADIEIDGSLSSQFLTGLLMAYGAAATESVTIKVNNLKSRPYIDLTLQVMEQFGRVVKNNNYESFAFEPSVPGKGSISYAVEGDWSGAAFLLVAGAVCGDVALSGLDTSSTQADRAILQALDECGCDLSINEGLIRVAQAPLTAFKFNAEHCPDLFPPMVALAACCSGTSVIEGVNRLTHKESNRGLTLQEEFRKMGVEIQLQGNDMLIKGADKIQHAVVHSRHDHRIAMACSVAALRATGPVVVEEADAINKSYPNFFAHLKKLGAHVKFG